MNEMAHTPVLLEEVLEFLDSSREGTYIDCTLGLAGHSLAILERNPGSRVIGFDLDEVSLREAKKNLMPFARRVRLFHSDFRHLSGLDLDFSDVRGILLDLGISSYQLDSPERGFSFSREGPLDMRMDLRNRTTAFRIIDEYSETRLAGLFHEFGELKQARRLAREIVSRRKTKKIETTTQLCRLIEEVCRWRPQPGKIHPAAKAFQALRIEINKELDGLAEFLERISAKIPARARIVAISFHSLEDRIIKHTFVRLAAGKDGPGIVRILTKKPMMASQGEVGRNQRARSAKLRAAEKR